MGHTKCTSGPEPQSVVHSPPKMQLKVAPKLFESSQTAESTSEDKHHTQITSNATNEYPPRSHEASRRLLECQPAVYNEYAASHLSAISGWSYSSIETFKDMISEGHEINHPNASIVEFCVRNDAMLVQSTAQVIRTEDKKVIIVSFRGTEMMNLVNWMTDASTKKMDFHGIGVHSGFLRNFKEVWYGTKGILAHLMNPAMISEDYNPDSSPTDTEENELEAIYITGHSLGGAMAMIAGLSLHQQSLGDENQGLYEKLRGVYTYGQPMVIDTYDRSECERLIGDKIFRHVFYNDIVPRLPPLSCGGFDHVGSEYRYHPRKGWSLSKEGWFCRGRVTQVVSIVATAPFGIADAIIDNTQWLPFVKMPWSFMDHSPIGYLNSLMEEINDSE